MISESEFQTAIDAEPRDWTSRLVFADWLDEQGDPRAAGYRALARLRKCALYCEQDGREHPEESPKPEDIDWVFGWGGRHYESSGAWGDAMLPRAWFDLLLTDEVTYGDPAGRRSNGQHAPWAYYPNRQLAEDTAAFAFLKLPPETQAEILNHVN